MDETHQILLDALNRNTAVLERLNTRLDTTEKDVLKLRYYIYTLAAVVMVLIGKPEWLAILL